jgi:hypothetical protein
MPGVTLSIDADEINRACDPVEDQAAFGPMSGRKHLVDV